jgi:hypothetical protein
VAARVPEITLRRVGEAFPVLKENMVCFLGLCAPETVSLSCSPYINVAQYTKGFLPLLVFFYYFPSYLPCKNLDVLSATGVNTVQTFADMKLWWDSLQLCVFCLPVLC